MKTNRYENLQEVSKPVHRVEMTSRAPYGQEELRNFAAAIRRMMADVQQDIKAQQSLLEDRTQDQQAHDHASYLISRQKEMLKRLESAMRRVEMGVFGMCVSCGVRIEQERLFAVPHTQLCVECKNKGRSAQKIISLRSTP